MTRLAWTFLLLATCRGIPESAIAQREPPRLVLALPGDVLGEGPWPEGGSRWLGLYQEEGGYRLRSVRLSIRTVDHACAGSATRISAPGPDAPLFLVRGVPGLRAGPVRGAFHGRLFLYPGQSRSVQVRDDLWYAFQAFGTALAVGQEALFTEYALWLRQAARAQRIASFPRLAADGVPEVLWAGDLDQDGKLDLFADLRQHYASHRYALLLSSAAAPDSLVRVVGHFDVSGC